MQQILSSKKYLKYSRFLLAVLTVFIFTAGIFLYVDSLFRVRIIRITGVPASFSLYGLASIKDSRMLLVDEERMEAAIKEANPLVSHVSVKKEYPDTLFITVQPSKPFMFFLVDKGYLTLNNEGRVLFKTKQDPPPTGMPVLRYYQKYPYVSYAPGDFVSTKDVKKAIAFVKKLQEADLKVNTIDIDGVDMIGLNLENYSILFSSEKDAELQIYQLEQILHQFRVQGKEFKKLDLRFNRPVIEMSD